ncbi:hypothetical protein [Natronococcus wangiae]|uniref:hypothetical protein n=1 Tax=Natronococcus wangiae TaxID=3068275 RepID=UPI00273E1237|nr:hypothetical protein [Natronococcus sp. AD5]
MKRRPYYETVRRTRHRRPPTEPNRFETAATFDLGGAVAAEIELLERRYRRMEAISTGRVVLARPEFLSIRCHPVP